jgi:transcriptional regulator with XRE-family HTH domain
MTDHIGTRIAYWRRRRGGMSQAVLAGLAGVSQAYISQVEGGHKPIDNRSTLVAVANALRVNISDLVASPVDSADPQRDRADSAVPAIRIALAEIEEGERRTPSRGRDEMRAAMDELFRSRTEASYATMAEVLPGMLTDAAGYGGKHLARVGYEAFTCLKNLGYRDLALTASRVAITGGQEAEDPAWLGSSRYSHSIALPLEAPGLASRAAGRALAELQIAAADPRARQMLGQLHLSAALTSIIDGRPDDGAAHVAEAAREAATLGDPQDGYGFNGLCFGPTNVGLWQMTLAAEMGEHGKVLELADRIEPRNLRVADRPFAYWMTRGRSVGHSGKHDREALVSLTLAERAAPTSFSRSQIATDTVSALVGRARRRSMTPELRIMARRLGVSVVL